MRPVLTALAATLTGAAMLPATTLAARPVSLSDARYAPQTLTLLAPQSARTFARQCPRNARWSDVSAYRWNGRALSAQRWSVARTFTYWTDNRYGGAVTFDGRTFRNDTNRAVLIAGFCDR